MTDRPGELPSSSPHKQLLERAAELARRYGRDPGFSRGGGGNVSVKADGVLYIKPSGVSLASLSAADLMALNMEPLAGLLAADPAGKVGAGGGSDAVMSVAMGARLRQAGEQRPSVEVLFHALIPRRFVLHTHPTIVNAVTCASEGPRIAAGLFGDTIVWVPYVDPGLPLARAIANARHVFEESTGRPVPDVLLLQNHGLIVAADEASAISAASGTVVTAIRARLADLQRHAGDRAADRAAAAPPSGPQGPVIAEAVEDALRASFSSKSQPRVVLFDASPDAVRAATADFGRSFALDGPITPDQIVYAGSWPLWLEVPPTQDLRRIAAGTEAALGRHLEAHGGLPTIVVVAGLGLFAVGATLGEAATARDVYLDAIRIGSNAALLGGVRVLAPQERRFIEEWEAEAYRRGVAAAAKS
jgi:rhamnose utilization protein RhaD (predicted bifunctional aldolase and dehydrogenase)